MIDPDYDPMEMLNYCLVKGQQHEENIDTLLKNQKVLEKMFKDLSTQHEQLVNLFTIQNEKLNLIQRDLKEIE